MLRPRPEVCRRRARRPDLQLLEGRALLATLTVANLMDSGPGSFRQAILDADAASGASTIDFAPFGAGSAIRSEVTIGLQSALPSITMPVTIDGTTEPGYAGTPLVVIDGGDSINRGLDFEAGSGGSTAKGLAIIRFAGTLSGGMGIDVNAPGVTIASNSIGFDPGGNLGDGSDTGIAVEAGTTGTAITGNVIVANGNGIDLRGSTGTSIAGNFIGTDSTGRADLGNGLYGIVAEAGTTGASATNNTIADSGTGAIDDLSGGGLTASANTLTHNGGSAPDLGVVASNASVVASVGQAITTAFDVTNQGSQTVGHATLTLQARNEVYRGMDHELSPVIEFTGGQVSQGVVLDVDTFTTSVLVDLGTLGPGRSATVTVSAQVIGAGPEFIDASAGGVGSPPGTAPAGVGASTAIVALGQGNRTVTALPAAPARVGVPETFTFAVADFSPSVSVDTLFALRFTTTGGTVATGVATSTGTVTALPAYPNGYGGDLGVLSGGQVATVTATIIPTAGGTVTASLFAYSPYEVDTAPADNLAFAASPVASASAPSVLGATLLPRAGVASAVAVYFDAPLNAAEARNARDYAVTAGGSAVAVRSAAYDAATHVVTLRLARALARPATARLVVAGTGSPGLAGSGGLKLANPGVALILS